MSPQNLISKIILKAAALGFLFCVFFAFNSYGQSDKEVEFADQAKKEKAYHPPNSEIEKKANQDTFSGYSSKKVKNSLREKTKYKGHSEKNDWKSEEVYEEVSTLSFNIFLYVLDRFKED